MDSHYRQEMSALLWAKNVRCAKSTLEIVGGELTGADARRFDGRHLEGLREVHPAAVAAYQDFKEGHVPWD
jgi:hypothetical protein